MKLMTSRSPLISNVVGDKSSGEVIESSSGIGDDGGDSDTRRAISIGVGR